MMGITVDRAFFDSVSSFLGADAAARLKDALAEPASVSVRLNPFKPLGAGRDILNGAVRVPWSPHGLMLPERPVFTLQPHFHSGAYYVQDSSAMFVGQVVREAFGRIAVTGRPVRVLDLCAAPGGKTTDLAASLRERFGDGFLLVSNEVMKNRASVLADNAARWGDPNVMVTNLDPKAFARLEGWFDMIVADVPCSGEGMFRKDEEAVAQWSEANVDLCASRQRRIVADVWPALAEGGVMVYSTCTFNRSENDDNAAWICSELGAEVLDPDLANDGVLKTGMGFALVPGLVPGEGQYCAAMVKTAPAGTARIRVKALKPDPLQSVAQKCFSVPVSARVKGGLLLAVPQTVAQTVDEFASLLPVMASGCAVGQVKGRDLIPDEDLALCTKLAEGVFPEVGVDEMTALKYLHKDALVLEGAPRGHVLLMYKGVPLGFVKNLGNRCNNLHPQGRRIMMDIQ